MVSLEGSHAEDIAKSRNCRESTLRSRSRKSSACLCVQSAVRWSRGTRSNARPLTWAGEGEVYDTLCELSLPSGTSSRNGRCANTHLPTAASRLRRCISTEILQFLCVKIFLEVGHPGCHFRIGEQFLAGNLAQDLEAGLKGNQTFVLDDVDRLLAARLRK